MQLLKTDNEFVRIVIGMAKKGYSGVKSPMKTISIRDTDVSEIYEIVSIAIQNKIKQSEKKKK